MAGHLWPIGRIEHLKELVGQRLSASQIADEIHKIDHIQITRNAVIGKVNRLGLHLVGYSGNRPSLPRLARVARKLKWKPKVIENPPERQQVEPQPILTTNPVMIADLDMATHCRFPLWNGSGPYWYCGGERLFPGEDGCGVYCSYHHNISFRPKSR